MSTNQTNSNQNQNQNQNTTTTIYYENKDLEQFIESNYVSFKDQETKVLEFVPNKTNIVDKTDFNCKPTKRVQFTVIDINDINRRRERILELSRNHIAVIYNELKKGKSVLEISRSGSGRDTRYFVKAVR
jgi:hypothetical protein